MDGYVNGLTGFKNDVYDFLSDLKSPLRKITNSLKLYYINSKPIPFTDDVEDFIKKLNPTTFVQRGGDRGQTDLSNIFGDILARNNSSNTVNVLISDCVFSPGRGKKP